MGTKRAIIEVELEHGMGESQLRQQLGMLADVRVVSIVPGTVSDIVDEVHAMRDWIGS